MTKGQLEAKISEIVSTHSDVSTKTGEKIIVIAVDKNLEELIKEYK